MDVSKNKRIVVAMSGGVDSSVAAYLLKQEGWEVIGITMQLMPKDEAGERFGGCCSLNDIEDARKTAKQLDIPHYTLNFRKMFKENVIDDFVYEYKHGRTPNPCIRCNQFLKFEHLLQKARELNAGHIATGHYARLAFSRDKSGYVLKKGKDRTKDQSYVLYPIKQQNLGRIIFPLGDWVKKDVKQLAGKLNFSSAAKKESQEICFIPENDYSRYLAQRFPEMVRPGPIMDTKSKVIGQHRGIGFYTIGQRKGLGIAAAEPLYVTGIDRGRNTIIAGSYDDCYFKGLVAKNLNLLADFNFSGKLSVKVRYRHKAAKATVKIIDKDSALVVFDRPQWAITPGQAVVFYDRDIVIGGGTIDKPLKTI